MNPPETFDNVTAQSVTSTTVPPEGFYNVTARNRRKPVQHDHPHTFGNVTMQSETSTTLPPLTIYNVFGESVTSTTEKLFTESDPATSTTVSGSSTIHSNHGNDHMGAKSTISVLNNVTDATLLRVLHDNNSD